MSGTVHNSPVLNPSDFLSVLERVQARLSTRNKTRTGFSPAEGKSIRSVVGAWFSQYQKASIQIVGEVEQISVMDERMQDLLRLICKRYARRTVVRALTTAMQHFTDNLLVPLSRAYWSRVPERLPAGRDDEAADRLRRLDVDLADSYEQAVLDIEHNGRLSYRGPAAELREVLTGVLHALAPDREVEQTEWYRDARRSGSRKETSPTRAERIKFILRSRSKGSSTTETGESFMRSVEERLANVVNAAYKRGSAATHGGTEQDELGNLLPYVNAVLREILPPAPATGRS